jgi:hypothetical protein
VFYVQVKHYFNDGECDQVVRRTKEKKMKSDYLWHKNRLLLLGLPLCQCTTTHVLK